MKLSLCAAGGYVKIISIVLILISIHGFAYGRVKNELSYETLEKVATLIVVAKPIDTKMTKKKLIFPESPQLIKMGKRILFERSKLKPNLKSRMFLKGIMT